MKNIVAFSIVVFVVVLFQGCTSYNIRPNYDKNSKTVSIETLKFSNANFIIPNKKSRFPTSLGFSELFETYNFNNGFNECKQINYYQMNSRQSNAGVIDTERDKILLLAKKADNNCTITTIENIDFYDCKINFSKQYYIKSNIGGAHSGYDTQVASLYPDDKCFYTIKKYFEDRANKDGVKIETQLIRNTTLNSKQLENNEYGFDENGIHEKTKTIFHPCGMTKKDILSAINDCETIEGESTYNYIQDSPGCLINNNVILLPELILEKYTGTFEEVGTNEYCVENGNIELIIFNNKLYGSITSTFKGKTVKQELKGTLDNDEFLLKTFSSNVYKSTYTGNLTKKIDSIKVKYTNGNCHGTVNFIKK